MLAATLAEPGRIEVGQVPEPELSEPGGAIVRVTRAAICGSDLYLYDGRIGIEPEFPLGHEFVGVVEEVGPDVRMIETGSRVTGSFSVSCGRCGPCQAGQHGRCLLLRFFGFGSTFGDLPGGQAERIFVPEADLTLRTVDDEISDEVAVLLGDNVVTAVDVLRRGRFQPGHVVAVLGAGATGLLTAQAALAFGAAAVVVHDTVKPRLELAERLGAIGADVSQPGGDDAVFEVSGFAGADLVVEATGTAEATATAVGLARKGGVVAVTSVHVDGEVTLPLGEMWLKDLDLVMHNVNVQARFDEVLALVRGGRISPDEVISHRLALADAGDGYAALASREATKVLLAP